ENLKLVRQAGLEAIRLRNELMRAEREAAGRTNGGGTDSSALSAEALAKEVANLKRGYDLRVLTTQELVRALELERQISDRLRDGTLALEERITLAQQLRTLQEITPRFEPHPRMADTMGLLPGLAPIRLEPIRNARAEVDA